MALFLDSASLDEARQAMLLETVAGITTNPALVAQQSVPPEELIASLAEICPGTVFYQLNAPTLAGRKAEARRILKLRKNIALKITCTTENLALAAMFAREGVVVGITTVYSPWQCYMACQTGARYVLPYVNMSTRLQGDGLALIQEIRAVIDACDSPVEILAASLKTPRQVVDTIVAGAHHVTVPLPVILEMGCHPLTDQAIEDFARANGHVRTGAADQRAGISKK